MKCNILMTQVARTQQNQIPVHTANNLGMGKFNNKTHGTIYVSVNSSHQSTEVTYHECTDRGLLLVVLYVNVNDVDTFGVCLLSRLKIYQTHTNNKLTASSYYIFSVSCAPSHLMDTTHKKTQNYLRNTQPHLLTYSQSITDRVHSKLKGQNSRTFQGLLKDLKLQFSSTKSIDKMAFHFILALHQNLE